MSRFPQIVIIGTPMLLALGRSFMLNTGLTKYFLLSQAGYAEKVASVWEKVADETRGYENCVR